MCIIKESVVTTENKTTSGETPPGNQKTDDTKPEQKDTKTQADAVKELAEKLAAADAHRLVWVG